MSTVTVFGATGYAGRAITSELLDRGHSVVAVARSADTLPEHPNLTTITGSLYDPTVSARATKGADVIVVALRAAPSDEGRLVDQLPALLASAADAGARLGFVGGAGSLRVTPEGPQVVESPGFPDEARVEALSHRDVLDALRGSDSDADWFYVSPAGGFGAYNPGRRTGRYRVGTDVLLTDADGRSELSAPDLAIAFADEIERPAHHRERFTVAY